MANYSVDEEIASFFDKTTTTREACDAFAISFGGCSTPVDIQGVCSYTVYAGSRSEFVVQFRLKSLKLSLEISHIARLIYGDFVPRVEYRGQLGEDRVTENEEVAATERKDSKTKGTKEALFIYVMDRIPGITQLDFVLAHNAEIPEASPGFAQWRMNLTIGVAKFFALSWKNPQNLDEAKKNDMRKRLKVELELLQRYLPKRFKPIVQRSLETLPDIFSTLPTVLSHQDFGACNVLVDSASCELMGVVDWAEAEIAPFGLNLHSYQRFLGAVNLRTGWSRYDDYAATEEAFWDTFCKESGEHDPT
ncbi:hypothetical protein SEUCBS139899_010420 [Sporothrix eucalyptigena]